MKRRTAARVEPPEWVRVFHRDGWKVPDAWEVRVTGPHGLGDQALEWHARRRWVAATNDWYHDHPEADHRLEGLGVRRRSHRATH